MKKGLDCVFEVGISVRHVLLTHIWPKRMWLIFEHLSALCVLHVTDFSFVLRKGG
jgi:hypothetical protein